MVYFLKSFLLCFDKSLFIRLRHVRHIKYRLNTKDKWYPKIYGIHKKIARIFEFLALEYIYFCTLLKQQLHKCKVLFILFDFLGSSDDACIIVTPEVHAYKHHKFFVSDVDAYLKWFGCIKCFSLNC